MPLIGPGHAERQCPVANVRKIKQGVRHDIELAHGSAGALEPGEDDVFALPDVSENLRFVRGRHPKSFSPPVATEIL